MADNAPVNESFCACNISIHKPKAQRSCNDTRCVGKWFADEWGKVAIYVHNFIKLLMQSSIFCSVQHQNVAQKGNSTGTFIVITKIYTF